MNKGAQWTQMQFFHMPCSGNRLITHHIDHQRIAHSTRFTPIGLTVEKWGEIGGMEDGLPRFFNV